MRYKRSITIKNIVEIVSLDGELYGCTASKEWYTINEDKILRRRVGRKVEPSRQSELRELH